MKQSDKEFLIGFFGILGFILLMLFLFLYRDYENKELKKHGVWTVMTITHTHGRRVYYTFELNNQRYNGKLNRTLKEINESGNYFFINVVPHKENIRRVYNEAPDWLEAPPEGWKKRPYGKELLSLSPQNKEKRTSGNDVADDVVSQPQTEGIRDTLKTADELDGPIVIEEEKKAWEIIIYLLTAVGPFLFLFLYRKKLTRYVEENGVWTIMTITKKESSDSLLHKKVYYTFQINGQTHTGSMLLSRKKVKSGNRIFMMVVPDNMNRIRAYDIVPDWFTSDAPAQGWEKHPTEKELREMINNKGTKQNR